VPLYATIGGQRQRRRRPPMLDDNRRITTMTEAHPHPEHDEDLGDFSFERWTDTYRDAIAIYQALIDGGNWPGIKVICENTSCLACLLRSVALMGLSLVCGATGMDFGPDGLVFSEAWEAELRWRLGSIRAAGGGRP
jgi:hypothetical protein